MLAPPRFPWLDFTDHSMMYYDHDERERPVFLPWPLFTFWVVNGLREEVCR